MGTVENRCLSIYLSFSLSLYLSIYFFGLSLSLSLSLLPIIRIRENAPGSGNNNLSIHRLNAVASDAPVDSPSSPPPSSLLPLLCHRLRQEAKRAAAHADRLASAAQRHLGTLASTNERHGLASASQRKRGGLLDLFRDAGKKSGRGVGSVCRGKDVDCKTLEALEGDEEEGGCDGGLGQDLQASMVNLEGMAASLESEVLSLEAAARPASLRSHAPRLGLGLGTGEAQQHR